MENKPQNVFEKLDRQEEKIDDISTKLEGISINDLYALAKRTWDYGDYQTAQKYYNHISLLKPLDWEAPLYASLCNFRGYHDMFFWSKSPEQVEKIIVSTIKYINNLELDFDKKEKEMSKCIEIINNDMLKTKDHYFKYKKEYDDTDSDYIYVLEEYFLNVYYEIKDIELKAIIDFKIALAENCLSLIETTKKISSKISKDVYEELIGVSSNMFDIDYDKIVEENKAVAKPKNDLSLDEIKEIKLKGKMYFEYNDKVIAKRIFYKKLISGALITVLSLIGIVFSLLSYKLYSLFFIFPLLNGIYNLLGSIIGKKKIKCSSIFCSKREKNRLTSNGDVIIEDKINILPMVFLIGSFLGIAACFAVHIGSKMKLLYRIVISISGVGSSIICILFNNLLIDNHHSEYNGIYSYLYKGKTYHF